MRGFRFRVRYCSGILICEKNCLFSIFFGLDFCLFAFFPFLIFFETYFFYAVVGFLASKAVTVAKCRS